MDNNKQPMNKKKTQQTDKNKWDERNFVVDKLVIDGVQVFPPINQPLKFIDEEEEYELPPESEGNK